MTYTLHTGDCREVMATLPAESVDAIVCDPPYGLSFMGKGWDHGVPGVDFWVEALRVLKPGGHLIAFGGTRTYHRLAVAIEDAGFEVRDCLMWLYGSGFPKSHNVSKAMDKQAGAEREVVTQKRTDMFGEYEVELSYGGASNIGKDSTNSYITKVRGTATTVHLTAPNTDLAKEWHGWGTALKPSYEPAILARKPLRGTVADNVTQWGTGALNIDGCRVEHNDPEKRTNRTSAKFDGITMHAYEHADGGINQLAIANPSGRWPANLILDEEAAAALDAQSGVTRSVRTDRGKGIDGPTFQNVNGTLNGIRGHSDTGGASRFFYTAKASRSEREAGLDGVEAVRRSDGRKTEHHVPNLRTSERANHHPTVKPIALMRYMIRLVAPRGAVVLDPFMGSGSTGCAAMVEGMQFVGIDITPEYVDIARRRLAWWSCSLDGNAIINTEENDDE
jgi:DNA modification methylase